MSDILRLLVARSMAVKKQWSKDAHPFRVTWRARGCEGAVRQTFASLLDAMELFHSKRMSGTVAALRLEERDDRGQWVERSTYNPSREQRRLDLHERALAWHGRR